MILWQVFQAFFIPGILGYGGGPASIPLVEYEVVHRYGWLTTAEFGEVLALGNALPGPIATKMAGYIGYEVAGVLGSVIALFATVGPSLILMIALLSLLYKHKDSPKVQHLCGLIRPIIAVLMATLTYRFFRDSVNALGWGQSLLLVAVTLFLLQKVRLHPAFVIAGSLLYGAFIIG